MSKRICVIPSWYPSPSFPYGGIFVRDQVHALARQHHVDVVTPWMVNWRDWLRFGFTTTMESDNTMNVRTWRVCRRQWPSLSRWLPFFPKTRELNRYFTQYCQAAHQAFELMLQRQHKPDVLHAHVVLPAGLAALRLGKAHGIPVVLTEHTGPFHFHLGTKLQQDLVHEVLAGVDCVIAVSPSLAKDIQSTAPNVQTRVVGNVIAINEFFPSATAPPHAPFRFLYAAVHYREKGIQYLLEAARKLRMHGRSFEIIIGGDGPIRGELERMAQQFGLESTCRFIGMLTREQMRSQMQACDVFVLPSLGETFGMVAVEAMACGKPVLATRCGGPEFTVAPSTGMLVPASDAAALAQAMIEFMDRKTAFDPKHIRDHVINRFGPDAFLRNINSIYDDVLSSKASVGCLS